MPDLEKAKRILRENGYTCVLCKGEHILSSYARGVAPLLGFLDAGQVLTDFCAADKVVGKGAAILYALLGITRLYADVISDAALEVLTRHGIDVSYELRVPHIQNRAKDGRCPIEAALEGIFDLQEALQAIRNTYAALQQKR